MDSEGYNLKSFVRNVRAKLGITQEQLADKLVCTKGNISAWEKGRHQPSYNQLCKMSEMSGIPLPHESRGAEKIKEIIGIDIEKLDIDQVEIILAAISVPKENRHQLKRIVKTFTDSDSDGGKQGSGGE